MAEDFDSLLQKHSFNCLNYSLLIIRKKKNVYRGAQSAKLQRKEAHYFDLSDKKVSKNFYVDRMNFFSPTRVRVALALKDALVRLLDIPNRQKSLTGLKSYFKVTIKCLSSPNTVFCLILLFFLKRMSHKVPIRSNPANTPSDTYMN